MSRVALTEAIFRSGNPVRFASGLSARVYIRGTTELATLYGSESGGSTLIQPLTTDSAGRPKKAGVTPWLTPGSYDLSVGGNSYPLELSSNQQSATEIFAIGMSKARPMPTGDSARDTENLQEALGDESPNEVLLGGGTYVLNQRVDIQSAKQLTGGGRAVSVITADDGVNDDLLRTHDYEAGGALDITIEKLTIEGNGTNQASGHCLATEGQRIHVKDVLLLNANEDGHHAAAFSEEHDKAGGGIDCRDYLVHAVACGRHGIFRDDHDFSLVDCQGIQCGDTGIYTDANGLAVNCHVWNYASNATACDIGFRLGTDVRAVNCTAEGASGRQVLIVGPNCQWVGGEIFNGEGFPNVPLIEWNGAEATSTQIDNVYLHNYGTGGALVFTTDATGSHIGAHIYDPEGKAAGIGTPNSNVMFDVSLGGSTSRGTIPGHFVRRRMTLAAINAATENIPNKTFIVDSNDSERLKFKDKDGVTSYVPRGSRGAMATAADNTVIDAAYGETEQKVIENLRTRQNELVSKLVEARILV